MKVVHVKWSDPAFASSGWMTEPEFKAWIEKGLPLTDSIGLLAHEDKHFIVLIQSVGAQQVAEAIKIGRSSIEEIVEIGEVGIELEAS